MLSARGGKARGVSAYTMREPEKFPCGPRRMCTRCRQIVLDDDQNDVNLTTHVCLTSYSEYTYTFS